MSDTADDSQDDTAGAADTPPRPAVGHPTVSSASAPGGGAPAVR